MTINRQIQAIFLSCILILSVFVTESLPIAAVNTVGTPSSQYPSSGYTPPDGSVILRGTVIGAATGWEDNPATGAVSAFDGNLGNNYDQKETGNVVTEYPGMMMEEKYILTAARVLPCTDADWQAGRMQGAAIQGSNDGEEWTTLYYFESAATVGSCNFVTVTEFGHNTGYTMFRYCNIEGNHTDCRELEFYGYPADSGPIPEDSQAPNAPIPDELEVAMEALEYTDSEISSSPLRYRLYLPESYSPDKSYSLLLHLHGAGERGADNKKQIADYDQTYLIRRILNDETLCEQFIIVAPQCPLDQKWVSERWDDGSYSLDDVPQSIPSRQVMSLLQKEITVKYSVDADRIYVTGLSMGGFGTWDLICRYPDYFAAAIPVCGGADASYADKIKHIPIWTFHSDDDTVVLPDGTKAMVEALTDLGADISYTVTDPWGHGAWTPAYQTGELLTWLTSKTRVERLPEKDTSDDGISDSESASVSGNESISTSQDQTMSNDTNEQKPDGNKSVFGWIGAAVIVVLLVAAGVILSKKKKK